MSWLVEAETRLNGHAGLARALCLIRDIVAEFGTDLHPRPEEPDDDPYAVLAGLNGIGREGALVQPLRLIPLIPGDSWGENSLWTADDPKRGPGFHTAVSEAGRDAMIRIAADVGSARRELDALDALLSDRLGSGAPPTATLRAVLEDTDRTIRRAANLGDSPPEEVVETVEQEVVTSSDGQIRNREDAFSQLLRISAYFRHAEPHSPIGYALETLVHRGRMDFVTLLQELIPDDAARDSLMTNAGIRRPKSE